MQTSHPGATLPPDLHTETGTRATEPPPSITVFTHRVKLGWSARVHQPGAPYTLHYGAEIDAVLRACLRYTAPARARAGLTVFDLMRFRATRVAAGEWLVQFRNVRPENLQQLNYPLT